MRVLSAFCESQHLWLPGCHSSIFEKTRLFVPKAIWVATASWAAFGWGDIDHKCGNIVDVVGDDFEGASGHPLGRARHGNQALVRLPPSGQEHGITDGFHNKMESISLLA
jgi:hypothetical protein